MTALVALLVGALVFAAAMLLLTTRRRWAISRRLNWFSEPIGAVPANAQAPSRTPAERVELLLDRLGATDGVRRLLERAGIRRSPGAFAGFVLLVAASVLLLLSVVIRPAAGIVAALVVPAVAAVVLLVLAQKRARAFEAQLPEILDMLSASLKAGHGFDQALQAMASDVGEPAASEFQRVIAETHLGRPLESALRDLGDRVRSEDLLFVLDAIMVQRQVGGSLADLFELVSETVRSREQFRRKLRAATGMARLSARVLTGLPVAAAAMLTLVNHVYMAPLFTTSGGHIMMAVIVVMLLVGGVVLRRVGEVKP